MGWFQKTKALNNVCPSQCNPIIVNQTEQSLVVFLDRGVLYNKQILEPGEAVAMTRRDTAGSVVPYKIHAVVGDQKALPSRTQSMKNLVSAAAIPTAFIVGTLMAASSAGTMTGPSRALSRVAGGLVVRGMVIDSAALAAGSLTASKAAFIADKLIEKHPENFSAKSGLCVPGQRYVVVQGGILTPLIISDITEKKFRQVSITGECKVPMDTLRDKVEFYTPSIFRFGKKEGEGSEETPAIEGATAPAVIEGGTAPAAIEEAAPRASIFRFGKKKKEGEGSEESPAIEGATAPAAIEEAAPPATAPPASTEEETEEDRQLLQALAQSASAPTEESEEDRQLRLALEQSAAAPAQETEEDRQLREAIEASLKLEEDRKQQEESYDRRLKADKRTPVVLF